MGIQGFPTLKIVIPSKKPGRPTVEDYKGPRSAKGIADALVEKIPNHVRRVSDQELDKWLQEDPSKPKVVLFSDKGTTSALIKALAIDFLGSISFGQIRDKEKKAVERFAIKSFPTLLVLQGSEEDPTVYDGELKKERLVSFLSKVRLPNPDPAPVTAKSAKRPGKGTEGHQKAMKDSSSFSAASSSHAAAEAEEAKASATSITLESANPTESPNPNVVTDDTPTPVPLPVAPATIPTLHAEAELSKSCRLAKSPLCILVLVATKGETEAELPTSASQVLSHLGAISHKHAQRQAKLFPFYAIPASNPGASDLRQILKISPDTDIDIVALNAKRSWWKRYDRSDLSREAIEDWIDAIRMGDIVKEKLPKGVVVAEEAEPAPIAINLENLPEDGPIKIELVEEVIDEHDEL